MSSVFIFLYRANLYSFYDNTVPFSIFKIQSFVAGEKHLLDHYSGKLHSFIKSALSEERNFSINELIQQWNTENLRCDEKEDLQNSGPSPSKKRRIKPQKRQNNHKELNKKAHQRKSIDASSSLVAQELVALTQYNNVFPTTQQGQAQEEQQVEEEKQQEQRQE